MKLFQERREEADKWTRQRYKKKWTCRLINHAFFTILYERRLLRGLLHDFTFHGVINGVLLPPKMVQLPDRPKKERRRTEDKITRGYFCEHCGYKGHNRRSCREPSDEPIREIHGKAIDESLPECEEESKHIRHLSMRALSKRVKMIHATTKSVSPERMYVCYFDIGIVFKSGLFEML
ncbi:hypothetical protein AMTR_s00126p00044840 [Amborella trichopoda]|uniref:CCHC-type domain-containing protein n=1 Tax=Amborella trichopoda TaxID=13333 RepID=W1NMI9_AMBTC|nr:hypothetical protein AMTR_s00126p00044840 [Amborella trichopoda]